MIRPIIVSTGQKQFVAEAKLLKASLEKHRHELEMAVITSLCPRYAAVSSLLPEFDNIELDIGAKRSDKYFAKFVICEFLEHFASDDEVLYLDTDHICRKKLDLPRLSTREVYVSSEVKPLEASISNRILTILKHRYPFLQMAHPLCHYNNSIIYGKGATLRSICDDWRRIYDDLYDLVPHSLLEELSFSFGLLSNGITIVPFSTSVQSSFYSFSKSCCLLHYGGSYRESKFIKERVVKDGIETSLLLEMIEDVITSYK